jgi:transcriptional regulator with XRE-family HTH domain
MSPGPQNDSDGDMKRLKIIREARGRDPHDLARAVGISSASYYGLEYGAPERAAEVTLRDVTTLCRELGVSASALFHGRGDVVGTPAALVEKLQQYLQQTGLTPRAFAQQTGWEIERLLQNPDVLAELDVDGLAAICGALELDWVGVLDEIDFGAQAARPLTSVRVLAGEELWGITSAADTICLQLGERRNLPARRGESRTVGAYALHIQCPCELISAGFTVSDLRKFVADYGPLPVQSVSEPSIGEIVLHFDANARLHVRPDPRSPDEQWHLFRPSERAGQLVYAGGRLSST